MKLKDGLQETISFFREEIHKSDESECDDVEDNQEDN